MSISIVNAQLNNETITKENVEKEITKAFYNFKETENTDRLERILTFVKKNPGVGFHDTIQSKVLYFNSLYHILSLQKFKEADSLLVKALELANKTNDVLLQGLVYNDRAVLSVYINRDFLTSNNFYHKALDCFKKVNNKSKQIETYYNLTLNERDLGNYKSSIECANNLLRLIGDNEDLLLYYKRIYYFIADSYIKLNQYEKAEEYINILGENLKKSTLNNRVRTYAWFYGAKADLDIEKKEHLSAINNLKEAIVYWRQLNEENRKSINSSFDRELKLQKQLQKEKDVIISNQNRVLAISFIAIFLLFLLIFMLVFFYRKNKTKNEHITKLNSDLKDLILNLKEKNADLADKKIEIEDLLKLNEQALFSRVLKISTYTDTITKITEDIDSYMDHNSGASLYLMTIRKKLQGLISEDELWEDFKIQFEKIRPEFFNKLKEVAPNLSVNDLKHCTYIVSNLKSKEVAQLINVSPRSVETTRYRIKKKMGLEKDVNLYDILSTL